MNPLYRAKQINTDEIFSTFFKTTEIVLIKEKQSTQKHPHTPPKKKKKKEKRKKGKK